MPSLPIRRPSPVAAQPPRPVPRPPMPRPTQPAEDAAPAAEGYLSFGKTAQQRVKESAENAGQSKFFPEFFITTAESDAATAKGEPGATVRVHFAVNYADPNKYICVPRVSIKEGGRLHSYTSPGNDCAIAAAGVHVSNRPCYVLVDHRSYKRKDNSTSQDEVKLWLPAPAVAGVMQNAITNLAENLGQDASSIDISEYEAKITKVGKGRNTTWAIDFIVARRPLAAPILAKVNKFFAAGYEETLLKLLAPNPKYMLSKGGRYTKPADYNNESDAGDEPPF